MADVSNVIANQNDFAVQLAELQRAFDQSFAEAPGAAEQSGELVLAIRAGSDQHVIRLSEIAGIHECPKVVPLPGTKQACLGIVGLRGRLHAVFRLSTLLGAASGQTTPKWLLVTPGRDAPTFAIDGIDACLAMRPEERRPVGHAKDSDGHLRELFVRDSVVRGLLDIPSLVDLAMGKAREKSAENP